MIHYTDPKGTRPAEEPKPALQVMHHWFHRDSDYEILERPDNLVCQYRDADPGIVCVADDDADTIPLETIKEIAITRIRSSGRYSHLLFLFLFGMYPAEPANARYHVNFQLTITTGKTKFNVITPFSFELKHALPDLLGERVHEITDEYAPLL
jgi:hypothetical protein